MTIDEYYGLAHEINSFAITNEFTKLMAKSTYALGQQLRPFCFFADDIQKEYGVIDFMTFNGFSGKTIMDEIAEYRYEEYKKFGVQVAKETYEDKKYLVFDYLLSLAICYVEIPKFITRNGIKQPSFDKYLCTRNPSLMAAWTGCKFNEAQAKYSPMIRLLPIDFEKKQLKFVKLTHTEKSGNSITISRNVKTYDTASLRVIPLFMLYDNLLGFEEHIKEGIVEFKTIKDNGSIRTMNVTLNDTLLLETYKDAEYVQKVKTGIDIHSVDQGCMELSRKITRGFIQVPEFGASIYDSTGTRALTLSRIVSMRKLIKEEVDLSYINVDLDSVYDNFVDALEQGVSSNKDAMIKIYTDLVGKSPENDITTVSMMGVICQKVSNNIAFLNTEYKRYLHNYMVTNADLFKTYGGAPNKAKINPNAMGIGAVDLADLVDFQ